MKGIGKTVLVEDMHTRKRKMLEQVSSRDESLVVINTEKNCIIINISSSHQAGAYPIFGSMKQVFLPSPPPWIGC